MNIGNMLYSRFALVTRPPVRLHDLGNHLECRLRCFPLPMPFALPSPLSCLSSSLSSFPSSFPLFLSASSCLPAHFLPYSASAQGSSRFDPTRSLRPLAAPNKTHGAVRRSIRAGRPEKREKSKVTVDAPEATAVTLSKTGSVALLTGSIYSILTEDVTVTLANNRILSSSIVGNICVQCRSPSADTSTRASGRSAALLMLKRSDGAQLKVLHNKRLMRPHSKSSRPREEEKIIQYRCLFPADGKARQVLQFEAPMARVTPTLLHMMMLFTCKRIKTGLLLHPVQSSIHRQMREGCAMQSFQSTFHFSPHLCASGASQRHSWMGPQKCCHGKLPTLRHGKRSFITLT